MTSRPCTYRGCADTATRGSVQFCEKHYRRRISMGLAGLVDSGPTIAHLEKLRAAGWTFTQIQEASGVAHTVSAVLLRERYGRVRKATADAILDVPVMRRASCRGVDSAGTRRRVQALAWMGWTTAEVAARAGATPNSLTTLILSNRRVSFALAQRVADVYDQLSHVQGPSTGAAAKARQFGHAPPAAWDEDTIDDPAAKPDLGDESARTAAELAEEARFLLGFGMSRPAVAKQLKISEAWLRQLLGGGKRAAA